MNWFKTRFSSRHAIAILEGALTRAKMRAEFWREMFRKEWADRKQLLARLELANDRAAIMDRLLSQDSDTIVRQQLVMGKQKEQIDELLQQLKQQKQGNGDQGGKTND